MLNELLKQAGTVAIGGHVRPDGDCVGSCMGLYQYIRDNFKHEKVDVYLEEIPDSFTFIKATGAIKHEIPEDEKYDLFICLDCGDEMRLGFSVDLFKNARNTLCVDHHISNKAFAEHNYIVPEASSTSELIYNLLDKEKMTKEIAEALYMGIAHDTGVFQYSCASPDTFRVAAELLECGIDAPTIIDSTYYEKTYPQNKVLGHALLGSRVFMDGKCIVSCITKEEMEAYGVKPKDLDGIVSQLRITKGVEIAIFMYELEEGVYKVSLRSKKDTNVSSVAQHFGGGGHVKAAGCSMEGSAESIVERLSEQIKLQFEKNEA